MSTTTKASGSWSWVLLMAIVSGALFAQTVGDKTTESKPRLSMAGNGAEVGNVDTSPKARTSRLDAPLRRYVGLAEPDPYSPQSETQTSAASERTNDDSPISRIRQTAKVWGISHEPVPKRDALYEDPLADKLAHRSLSFLIVTMADPVDSAEGYRFDLQLDTLHKALSVNQNDPWVLASFYMPWQSYRDRAGVRADTLLKREAYYHRDEPGVIVYSRPRLLGDRKSQHSDDVLVVLVVGETPTTGIQRQAFQLAVKQIVRWDSFSNSPKGSKNTPLRISVAGPTFTGSGPPLAACISEFVAKSASELKRQVCFDVISGSATAIDPQMFDKIADENIAVKDAVRFGATAVPSHVLQKALTSFVESRAEVSFQKPVRIAWLVESNTAFGATKLQKPTADVPSEITYFSYPLHIASVRATYEQRRAQDRAQMPIVAPLPGTASPLPFEAISGAQDLPSTFTPTLTAPQIELMLRQILQTIDRGGYQYVGITATDIRDPIFLADQIKDHCPRVQLLIPLPDLLHTHPQYRASLAGAIVATGYPMIADAQDWCYPFRARGDTSSLLGHSPAVFHSNPAYAGLYNAIILLRSMDPNAEGLAGAMPSTWSNDRIHPTLKIHQFLPLCCYGAPHPTAGAALQPVSWISSIGSDTAWPIDVYPSPGHQPDVNSYTVALEHSGAINQLEALCPTPRFGSRYLALVATLVAILVVLMVAASFGYLAANWLRPLDGSAVSLDATSLSQLIAFAICYIGAAMLVSIVAGISLQHFRHTSPNDEAAALGNVLSVIVSYLAIFALPILGLRWLYWIWVFENVAPLIRLGVAVVFIGAFTGVALPWLYSTLALQPFQIFTLSGLFNGVSPIFASSCAALAIWGLGFISLRKQSDLARAASRGVLPSESPTNPLTIVKFGWTQIVIIAALTTLWVRIFHATTNVAMVPWQQVLLFAAIVGGNMVWWLQFTVLWGEAAQLRRLLHKWQIRWQRNAKAHWHPVFVALSEDADSGIGRLLYGPRPSRTDAVNVVARRCDGNPLQSEVIQIYRDVQLACRQLRILIIGLGIASVLLFLAVVTYPFTTGPMMRFMISAMLMTISCFGLWLYIILDRDPFLSHMLNSAPLTVSWNWTLVRNVSLAVIVSGLALIAQVSPDAWTWLWSVAQGTARIAN